MTFEKTTSIVRLALGATALTLIGTAATADQVILDDLIVDGSICAGLDCVNGESFGFDTLRLKENNLRIKFQDTSTSASFPSADWQITANDSSNGGQNRFSIENITDPGGRIPFTIRSSAPSHSLYVDDSGRVGFGTNSPVVELHVKDGDTPTLRLEQDGTSGFASQTWDVAGNETNFFIRDVTNGSRLPIRSRPGAPTSSIDINANGDIGFGIQNVASTGAGNKELKMKSDDAGGKYGQLTFVRGTADVFGVGADNTNFYIFGYGVGASGQNVFTINRTTGALTMNGNLTVNGNITCTGTINGAAC